MSSAAAVRGLYESLYTSTFNKVVCVGKNYAMHAKEMGGEVPKNPLLFDKCLSNIIQSGDTLYLRHPQNQVHHEVELGLLIGKKLPKGSFANTQWKNHIEGYFLGIDFTDRDLQGQFKKNGTPWTLGKCQDGFFAVSGFVEGAKVRNPHDLELTLKINDKVVQQDSTKNMIYQIPTILEYISHHLTLQEGDMILTGTPAGVGPVKGGDYIFGTLGQGKEDLATLYMKVESGYAN
ncbi:hypothetical protein FGO68_gene15275 [Halteria grandinella]|uniref:Fumarylacetoacetase-like C-terminal domain-containing protein n=1 Tax=Halteria grandinella TaxID=5974 RepID=A0A8J8SVP0_HALGN|nr:hypothetical protein FGO68_gene15275 [Halteria grandinella]